MLRARLHSLSSDLHDFRPAAQKSLLISETEIDPQTQKTNLWLPKGKGEGGICSGFGPSRNTILYIIYKFTNMVQLYSTGNYTQCLVMTCDGKESEEKNILSYILHVYKRIYIHIYIKLYHYAVHLK